MAAEIPQAGEISPAEFGIKNETIDRVAVFAVRNTTYMEPPLDVAGFVSEFTGIDPEHVQKRMTVISAGGNHPLQHNEATGRLQVNSDSTHAEELLSKTQDEILVGNTDFSTRRLRSLLAQAIEVQRTVNAVRADRQQYAAGFSFSPTASHRQRPHIEKLAESQGRLPGEPVTIPGSQIVIRAPRLATEE